VTLEMCLLPPLRPLPPHRFPSYLPLSTPHPQVFIERAAKGVRRSRMEREKRASEERAERMAAGRTPGKRVEAWRHLRTPAQACSPAAGAVLFSSPCGFSAVGARTHLFASGVNVTIRLCMYLYLRVCI
jgi:hypothetical protein